MACKYYPELNINGINPGQASVIIYEIVNYGEINQSSNIAAVYRNTNPWLFSSPNHMLRWDGIPESGLVYGNEDRFPCEFCIKPKNTTTRSLCLESMFWDASDARYRCTLEDFETNVDTMVWESPLLPKAYKVDGIIIPQPDQFTHQPGTLGLVGKEDLMAYLINWINTYWLDEIILIGGDQLQYSNDEFLLFDKFNNKIEDYTYDFILRRGDYPVGDFPIERFDTDEVLSIGVATGEYSEIKLSIRADLCGCAPTPEPADNRGFPSLSVVLDIHSYGRIPYDGLRFVARYRCWEPNDVSIANNLELNFHLVEAIINDQSGVNNTGREWDYSSIFNAFDFPIKLTAVA